MDLGPTVDDLSQEVAAQAAGVELVFSQEWFGRMEELFRRRSRVMPPNNRKQAMLPAGAELLDNPIGTACGFALDIGKARFFFTPGVPRELHRMLDEQIIPRLLARSGRPTASFLKRFHSYGLGESHVDSLLAGVEALVPDGSVKLGFAPTTRAGNQADGARRRHGRHPPKARAGRAGSAQAARQLHPGRGRSEARGRGPAGTGAAAGLARNRGNVHGRRNRRADRPPPGCGEGVSAGSVAADLAQVCAGVGLDASAASGELTEKTAEAVARAARHQIGATHALAVLVALDEGPDRIDFGATICLAIATEVEVASRRSRIVGGREWVRLGAVEMALDCLRRHLQGLPVGERIDFEKV